MHRRCFRAFLGITAFALLASLVGGQALAATLGEDGLHEQDWFALTFRDIAEDMSDAANENKRLVILFEQPGCSYCEKLHATVLSDPEVVDYLTEHYVVVQYHLYGDEEVIDLDGEVLTEKTAAEKWGVMFTPLWLFLPEEADGTASVEEAAIGTMPGVFSKSTFLDLFAWVNEKGYEGDEAFQRYHMRRLEERRAAAGGADVSTD